MVIMITNQVKKIMVPEGFVFLQHAVCVSAFKSSVFSEQTNVGTLNPNKSSFIPTDPANLGQEYVASLLLVAPPADFGKRSLPPFIHQWVD